MASTTKYGYERSNTADSWWAERPPRNYARSNVIELNLFDGGHGDPAITFNPILLGLGVTLRMRLNPAVRTFQVFSKEEGGAEIDVTPLFKKVATNIYEVRGVIGDGSLFNPAGRAPGDWIPTVTLQLRVVTTNITKVAEYNALLRIADNADIRSCPDACDDDFELLQPLRRNNVRLWLDANRPTRQPGDTVETVLWYFFESAQGLIDLAPEICACFNWHTLVHVGLRFSIVGDCAASAEAQAPFLAGCNPWDETLDAVIGTPFVLPAAWAASGCP